MKKRLLSLFLTLTLCLGMLPATSQAADGGPYTVEDTDSTVTYTFDSLKNLSSNQNLYIRDLDKDLVLDLTGVPSKELQDIDVYVYLLSSGHTVTVKGDPDTTYDVEISLDQPATVVLEDYRSTKDVDFRINSNYQYQEGDLAEVIFDGRCTLGQVLVRNRTLPCEVKAKDSAAHMTFTGNLGVPHTNGGAGIPFGKLTLSGSFSSMFGFFADELYIEDSTIVFQNAVTRYNWISGRKLEIKNSSISNVEKIYSFAIGEDDNSYAVALGTSIAIEGSTVRFSPNNSDNDMLYNAETITIDSSTIEGKSKGVGLGGVFHELTIQNGSNVYFQTENDSAIGPDTWQTIIPAWSDPTITIADSTIEAASRLSPAIGMPWYNYTGADEDDKKLHLTINIGGSSNVTATSIYSSAIGGGRDGDLAGNDDGLIAAVIVGDIGKWADADGGDGSAELSSSASASASTLRAAPSLFSSPSPTSNAGDIESTLAQDNKLMKNCTINITGSPTIHAKSGVLAIYGTVDMTHATTNLVESTMVQQVGSSFSIYPMETPGDVTVGNNTIGQMGYGYASVASTGIGAQTSQPMKYGDAELMDAADNSIKSFTIPGTGFTPLFVTPALELYGNVALNDKNSNAVTAAAVGDTLTADLTGLLPTRAKTRDSYGNTYRHLNFTWYADGTQRKSGDTSSDATYTIQSSDADKVITCVVSVKGGDTQFKGSVTSSAVLVGNTNLAAPTLERRTTDSITLTDMGAGYQYKIIQPGETTTWQDSPTFSGLDKGTSYTFVLRNGDDISVPASFYTMSDQPNSGDFTIRYTTKQLYYPSGVYLYRDAACEECLNPNTPQTWLDISGMIADQNVILYARYYTVDPSDTDSVTQVIIPARPTVNQVAASTTETDITFLSEAGVTYRLTLDGFQVGELKVGTGGELKFENLSPGCEYILQMRKEAKDGPDGNFTSAQVNQKILTKGVLTRESTLLAPVTDAERTYDLTALLSGLPVTKVEKTDGSFVTAAEPVTGDDQSIKLTFDRDSLADGATTPVIVTASDGNNTLTLALTVEAVNSMATADGIIWVQEETSPAYVGLGNENELQSAWRSGLYAANLADHTHDNTFALLPRYIVGGGTATTTETPQIQWSVTGAADAAGTDFVVLAIDTSKKANSVQTVTNNNGTLSFPACSTNALYLVAWKESQDSAVTVELKNGANYIDVFQFGDTLTAQISVKNAGNVTGLPLPSGTVQLWLGQPNGEGSTLLGEESLKNGSATITYELKDWDVLQNDPQMLTVVYSGDESYNRSEETTMATLKAIAPGQPVLTATPGVDEVLLEWEKPSENGTSIIGYTLTVKQNDTPIDEIYLNATDTSYTVSGLTGGTEYTFTLTANSNLGSSRPGSVSASPLGTAGTVLLVPLGEQSDLGYNLYSILGDDTLTDAVVTELDDANDIIDSTTCNYKTLTLRYDTTSAQAGDTAILQVQTEKHVLTLTLQVVESLYEWMTSATPYCWVKSDADYSLAGFESQDALDAAWQDRLDALGMGDATIETFALQPRYLVGGEIASVSYTYPWMDLPTEITDPSEYRFVVLSMSSLGQLSNTTPTIENGIKFTASYYYPMYCVAWQKIEDASITATLKNGDQTDATVFCYGDTLTAEVTVTGKNDFTSGGRVRLWLGEPNAEGSVQLGYAKALDEEGKATLEYKLTEDVLQNDPQTLYIVYSGDDNYRDAQIEKQVTFKAAPPSAPSLSPEAQVGAVTLTWNTPQVQGASIIGYELTVEDENKTAVPGYDPYEISDASVTTHTVRGLTGGQTYTFTLTAKSSAGDRVSSSVTATPLSADSGTILVAAGTSGTRTYDLSQWLGSSVTAQTISCSGEILSHASCSDSILSVTYNDVTASSADASLTIETDTTELNLTIEVVEVAAQTDAVFWVKETAEHAGMTAEAETLSAYLGELGMSGAATDTIALLPRNIVGGAAANTADSKTITWTPASGLDESKSYRFDVLHIAKGDTEPKVLEDVSWANGALTFPADGSYGLYLVAWQTVEEPAIAATLNNGDQADAMVFSYGDTLTADIDITGGSAVPTGTVELYFGDQSGMLLDSAELENGNAVLTYTLDSHVVYGPDTTLTIVYAGDENYKPTSETKTVTFQALAPEKPIISPNAGQSSVTITWQTPEIKGTPITGYTLTVTLDGMPQQEIDTIQANEVTYTVNDLIGGLEYTFTLTAHSSAGDSVSDPVTAVPLADGTGILLLPAGETQPRSYDLSRWLGDSDIQTVTETSDSNNIVEKTEFSATTLTIHPNAVQDGQSASLTVQTADGNTLTLTVNAVTVAAEADGVFWIKQSAEDAGMTSQVSRLESYLQTAQGMTDAETETFALLPQNIVGGDPADPEKTAAVTWTPAGALDMDNCRMEVLHIAANAVTVKSLTFTREGDALRFTADGQDGLYMVAWQARQMATIAATLTKDGAETDTFQFGETLTAEVAVTGTSYSPTGTVRLYLGAADDGVLLASGSLDLSGKASMTYTLDDRVTYGSDIQLTIIYAGDKQYNQVSTTCAVTFQPLAPDKPTLKADAQINAVALTWETPGTKGAPITDYTLAVEQDGKPIAGSPFTIPAAQNGYPVTGLVGGYEYRFVLTANSSAGSTASEPITATPITDGSEVILLPVGSGTRKYDLSALLGGATITNATETLDSKNIISDISFQDSTLTLGYNAANDSETAALIVEAEGENGPITLTLTVKAVTVAAEKDGVFWVKTIANGSYVGITDNDTLFAAWTDAMAQFGFTGATRESFAVLPRNIVGGDAADTTEAPIIAWTPDNEQIPVESGNFLVLRIRNGETQATSIDYDRSGDSLTFPAAEEDALYAVVYKAATGGSVTVHAELRKGSSVTTIFQGGDTLTAVVTITPGTEPPSSILAPGGTVELWLGDPDNGGQCLSTGQINNGTGTITYILNDPGILSYEEKTLYVVYPGDNNYLPAETTINADLWPAPSSGGSSGSATTYSVTVADTEHGTVTVSPKRTSKGSTVTVTTIPDEGYELGSLTVTDRDNNEIKLTDKGDGKFTFTMPGSTATVTATFASISSNDDTCNGGADCPLSDFVDLDTTAWYHDGVHFCLANGMMGGYGNGIFGPNDTLSRAMLVQVLYNCEGRPAVSDASVFADVEADAWYADAVAWAAKNGIVGGYGNENYGPDDPITREQLAAILYRYAVYKGYDTSIGEETNILSYADALAVNEWAIPAMQWAVGAGIIQGVTEDTLVPQGNATRAQVAVMLMRFCTEYLQ